MRGQFRIIPGRIARGLHLAFGLVMIVVTRAAARRHADLFQFGQLSELF